MTDDNKTQTPPWGEVENFDADKAWTLILNLRKDVETLKTDKATLTTERDALVDEKAAAASAGQTEAEKAEAAAAKTATDLAAARKELWIERALRKHSVPEELVEFLTGDDEDAILSRAAKLAGLPAKPADEAKTEPKTEPKTAARPQPALTAGHGGDENVFDADAIVSANFG
ncbi:head scaffolding protein [Microbacterium phage phiMiGM15]